jgi:hypothetical protein
MTPSASINTGARPTITVVMPWVDEQKIGVK